MLCIPNGPQTRVQNRPPFISPSASLNGGGGGGGGGPDVSPILSPAYTNAHLDMGWSNLIPYKGRAYGRGRSGDRYRGSGLEAGDLHICISPFIRVPPESPLFRLKVWRILLRALRLGGKKLLPAPHFGGGFPVDRLQAGSGIGRAYGGARPGRYVWGQ